MRTRGRVPLILMARRRIGKRNCTGNRGSRVGCVFQRNATGTFFIGFFEFGQGHRGPMIPYCPGAP
ncbi:unnamed protein product, partial [Staurois parvus]